jgi:hypothetical protein
MAQSKYYGKVVIISTVNKGLVELLIEFQPFEMVRLICLEPRPRTGERVG